MKTLKIIIVVFLAIALGSNSYAQTHDHSKMKNTKTETLKVSGKCDMCKAHIEKAAKVDGVSNAVWNKETNVLSLVYKPSVISSDDIQKKIAAVGYDTEKFKASDKAYAKLSECCKYNRKK